MKTKFQIFQITIPSSTNIDVSINTQIDKRYKKVLSVKMYTDTVLADNLNLNFEKDLRIDSEDVFPENFDSALLFPTIQNEEHTKLKEPIELKNYKLEGRFTKTSLVAPAACTLKIMLELEVD